MRRTILIAGCGYVGTALGLDWIQEGGVAYGLRRDIEALDRLAALGIRPAFGDLLDPQTLVGLPEIDYVVLCQALSRKSDDYEGTYLQATRNLLTMLKGREPQKLLFISSTSVYGAQGGAWVDERTDPMAGFSQTDPEIREHARVLLETEQAVLQNGIPAVVLRLGGIYGPGRNRVRAIRDQKHRPTLSDIYTNRIHLSDIVRAVQILLDKGEPGEVYLGVDDGPCTQKEFYEWLCEKLGVSLERTGSSPDRVMARASNKRCSNAKLKSLGMVFQYPTYREGYDAIIKEERA